MFFATVRNSASPRLISSLPLRCIHSTVPLYKKQQAQPQQQQQQPDATQNTSANAAAASADSVDVFATVSFKPHLNLKDLQDKLDEHIQNVKDRKLEHIVDVVAVATKYRESGARESQLNAIRHLRKSVASLMQPRFTGGKNKKPVAASSGQQDATAEGSAAAADSTPDETSVLKEISDCFLSDLSEVTVNQELSEAARQIIRVAQEQGASAVTVFTPGNPAPNVQAKQLWVELGRLLKIEVSEKEAELEQLKEWLLEHGKRIPNLSHPSVPRGEDPTELRERGVAPPYTENDLPEATRALFPEPGSVKRTFLNHDEIASKLDLIDFDSGSFVAGPKFFYFKNQAVLLELALIQYAIQKIIAKGFTPYTTPELARRAIIEGCGFQPRGEHSQIYNIEGSDLSLIGTSEITLAGMNADKILSDKALPLKIAGISHCFRTEAGSGGRESHGIYRVHQFTKVEMFVYSKPEDSDRLLEEIISVQEDIFASLGFHFKILNMPAHDLGAPASRKVDIEAYMPGRQKYGELSSTSNCLDFQSRRLFTRYRDSETKANHFVHTLNGTAIAIPRVILTLLEQYQYQRTDDGRIGVVIPPVLRPFLGGLEKIEEPVKPSSAKSE